MLRRLVCASVFVLCLSLSFATQPVNNVPPAGNVPPAENEPCFTAVFSAGECSLHPHKAYSMTEAQIMTALYEGLFVYEPATLEPLPGYAESWALSADKKQWTITIRKDATFSNGDPITAQVFVDSWKALLNPKLNAPYASMLDFIIGAEAFRTGQGTDLGVKALDEHTLQINLTMTIEYLPKILCHYSFSAVHPSMLNETNQIPLSQIITSGAYIPTSYEPKLLTLRKNIRYWDAANVAVPSVMIKFTDDPAVAVDLFNKGEVQWLESGINVEDIVQKSAIRLIPSFSTEFFYFRCSNAPWDNATVRTLLSSILPWEEIRSDFLIPAKTLIFPLTGYPELHGIEEGEELDIETFQTDIAAAANCPIEDFPELLISIPEAEHLLTIATTMKETWESVGLKVRIEQLPISVYYAEQTKSTAAIRMMSWVGDFADPIAFLELFRPTSALNESHWQNDAFDPLLRRASRQKTQEKRYEILGKAEQLILDDGVIMPISFRPSINAIDDTIVQGWSTNVLDIHPFKFLKIIQRKPIPNMI